jgi:hypothetical protein
MVIAANDLQICEVGFLAWELSEGSQFLKCAVIGCPSFGININNLK